MLDRLSLSLFDVFDTPMDLFAKAGKPGPAQSKKAMQAMKIDIKNDGDKFLIHAELPGCKKEDIAVDLIDGNLNISASKSEEISEEKNGYIHKESYHGKVSRSIYVGEGVTVDDIKASLNDGILTITVPKKEDPKPTANRIAIE